MHFSKKSMSQNHLPQTNQYVLQDISKTKFEPNGSKIVASQLSPQFYKYDSKFAPYNVSTIHQSMKERYSN